MRTPSLLIAAALVASTLTVGLIGATATSSAAAGGFEERPCSTHPAPCLVAASRNGTPITSASTNWEVLVTEEQDADGNRYFQWMVADIGGPDDLSTSDDWILEFNTGTLDPRYTEGYAGTPYTERILNVDGSTFRLEYTAKPVLTAFACAPDGGWPTTCPAIATDDDTTGDPADDKVSVMLYGEVQDKAGDEDFRGFDVAQNADEVNGPFLETASDGSQYLEAFMANSHQYDSNPGPTVTPVDFVGQVRWRLPYRMLKNWFGIPNPALMVPTSLKGRPDGTPSTATFTFTHEPVDNAWVVDATDIGFSKKVLRVKTGMITPTKPGDPRPYRTSAREGAVGYDLSSARGARVTGYLGRCVAVRGDDVVTASGDRTQSRLDFNGLRRDVAYDCKVRATSKVGPSRWSDVVRVPGQLLLPD
jgi:hypothetical protein